MSTHDGLVDYDDVVNNAISTTETVDAPGTELDEGELTTTQSASLEVYTELDSVLNATGVTDMYVTDTDTQYMLLEKFVITEIVMTTLELIISVVATIKMSRWRKNYRNQMLLQFTIARFIKRMIFIFSFLADHGKITSTVCLTNVLTSCQLYIDFVIVILVFFFIKHMYNCLLIVLVKVRQNHFYRVLFCSWLIPLPISGLGTLAIVTGVMDKHLVYLLTCCIFRWPLIFVGTWLYIVIMYRVLADKIRQFASCLALVTFLLCLVINVYLFSKDVIELWCHKSFSTELIGYVSGLLLNVLSLTLYAVLIILTVTKKTHVSKTDIPDYSIAEAKCSNV